MKDCLLGVGLKVEGITDLRRLLKTIGYSEDAVKEILKWYQPSD